MDLQLAGRSVLLIGAGRGLGGAAAVALAREKAKVAVVARTAAAVEAKASECLKAGAEKTIGIAADATDPASLKKAIEATAAEFGGLDALVTLVGGSQPGGTAELSGADWEAAYERNLWPAIRASRYALPHLIASAARRGFSEPVPAMQEPQAVRDASVVLHVASIWGREGGGPLAYNTAKAALIALAHEQARELAPRGVRVLSLAPGSTLHPGGSWERRLKNDPATTVAFVQREIPFGRFGTAEEIGDVIAFLLSPRASWMAGCCVTVDGGQSRSF
ncbi:MAG: SDR family NAD(P)-dependent oxidoreductase [Myxococcales bacterium]